MSDIENRRSLGDLHDTILNKALFQENAVDIEHFVECGFIYSFNKECFMVHAG